MPSSVFTDAYQALIATLVEARTSANLTQVELASRLNRPQSFISKYERGERRLDVLEFWRIAVSLDYSPEELFLRTRERLPPSDPLNMEISAFQDRAR